MADPAGHPGAPEPKVRTPAASRVRTGWLIALSGLPGTGKTTLAGALAERIGAVHLRIDTIEDALAASSLAIRPAEDAGYVVAYALAEDNVRLGHTVIADSVNPLGLTRTAWTAVAERAGAALSHVEITCADTEVHRARVEARHAASPHDNPDWAAVQARGYEPWTAPRIVIDNSGDLETALVALQRALTAAV